MIVLILVLFIVAVAYCVRVLRWPWGPCRKCQGRKVNKGSNRKRWGMCKACGGTGQRQRFGARAVHRFWWSVLGTVLHEKRKEQVKEARKKAGYPELLWTPR